MAKKKRKATLKNNSISNGIKEVMKMGVRKNTHKPVSKSNPRRKVPIKQAIAIAESKAGNSRKKRK